jgi:hypothetical protein
LLSLRPIFDEIALLVEVLNALNNLGVVLCLHERTQAVQDVDFSFEEDCRVEVAEDVRGDNDRPRLVAITQHLLEFFFEVICVRIKTAVEESVAFEDLFFPSSLPFFEFSILQFLRVVIS